MNYNVIKHRMPWRDAYFYQKAEVLYHLTDVFCRRFLPAHGDRTVDQMRQAARSGKQNIIEGTEDGETSTEMYIKLLNVARGSIQELCADYIDFMKSKDISIWDEKHDRYTKMTDFCRKHNKLESYQPYFESWKVEDMCNVALTLCYMTDTMLNRHLSKIEKEFVEQGGIKERMHAARTRYRQAEKEELENLHKEVPILKAEISRLRALLERHGIPY